MKRKVFVVETGTYKKKKYKRKKKKVSPETADTVLRMWNDLRKTHDLEVSRFKTNKQMKEEIMKIDDEYGEYFNKVKNPLSIIKSQTSTNIFNYDNRRFYEGETEKVRTAIIGINRANVFIKKTDKDYEIYGSKGKLLRTISKEEVDVKRKWKFKL